MEQYGDKATQHGVRSSSYFIGNKNADVLSPPYASPAEHDEKSVLSTVYSATQLALEKIMDARTIRVVPIAILLAIAVGVGCNRGQDRQDADGKVFGERKLRDGTVKQRLFVFPNGTKYFDVTWTPDGTEKVGREESHDGTKSFDVTYTPDGINRTKKVENSDGSTSFDVTFFPDGTAKVRLMVFSDGQKDFDQTQLPDGTIKIGRTEFPNGWKKFDVTISPDKTENVGRAIAPDGREIQPPKILTKEPKFWKLLHPPEGEALLDLSADYQQKRKEIETKLASIQDAELKKRMYEEEWAKVDKAVYISNESQKLKEAFPVSMKDFLEKHRQDWFELGHVEFSGTDRLDIKPVEASLVDFDAGSSIEMNVYTMDGVYAKFHAITNGQISQMANAWMREQSCTEKLKNVCSNLGGTPTECASPSTLQEIQERLGPSLSLDCNDHPSVEEGRKIAAKQLRADRIVLVGQGDPASQRIDQCMLVDYDTETVLLEIDPKVLAATQLKWKYGSRQLDSPSPTGAMGSANLSEQPETPLGASQTVGDAIGKSETSVRDAVGAWVSAFRSKDTNAMSNCYAPLVEKYFLRQNVTREQLRRYEESAFARTLNIRKYEISDVHVKFLPPDQKSADSVVYSRAAATFNKQWETTESNGKTFSGEEIEQLTFTSSPEGWKIVREEEEKIIRVSRR
jgi:hypothetical protein